jgi:hypothetical protein
MAYRVLTFIFMGLTFVFCTVAAGSFLDDRWVSAVFAMGASWVTTLFAIAADNNYRHHRGEE